MGLMKMDMFYQFLIFFSFFICIYSIALCVILKSKPNSTIYNRLKNKNRFLAMTFSFIGLFISISMAVVAYINHIGDVIWNYFLFGIANLLILFGIGVYIGTAIKDTSKR